MVVVDVENTSEKKTNIYSWFLKVILSKDVIKGDFFNMMKDINENPTADNLLTHGRTCVNCISSMLESWIYKSTYGLIKLSR